MNPSGSNGEPGRSIYMEVFGCQMNKLDGELILGQFARDGYRPASDPNEADVLLVHTCSVRDHAEQRVYSRVGAWKYAKTRRPELVIGVVGCMAEREREEVRRRLPHVDIVCGTRDFPRLPEMVREVRETGESIVAVGTGAVEVDHRIRVRSHPHQAFVTAIRGCNKFCSFCIVPYVRGKEVSRPPAEIVDEVRALVDDGVVEVTLLGQTINHYGHDLEPKADLASLLRLLDRIDGLRRIHFVTSYPRGFDDDLIRTIHDLEKVSSYVHMPPQSGSDTILARMRRGYTRARYLDRIDAIRRLAPEVEIAGDWIVGFPGETEADHRQSEELLREVGFVQSFVFKYSPRPGTPSAERLADDVPEDVKKERNHRLLAIQAEVALKRNRRYIGRDLEVLVEGPSRRNPSRLEGRSKTHHIVTFPKGSEASEEAGTFVTVRIEGATALSLRGRVVGRKRRDAPAAPAPPSSTREVT